MTKNQKKSDAQTSIDSLGTLMSNSETVVVKKGLTQSEAYESAKDVSKAGHSIFDGQCGGGD